MRENSAVLVVMSLVVVLSTTGRARCSPTANPTADGYGFWADGDGNDKSSPSRLYFCNKAGDVHVLPPTMSGRFAQPKTLDRKGKTQP